MPRPLARFGDRTKYGKRHTPGEMNQTEAAYAAMLETRKLAGEVIEWHFESITFKLADGCRYTPDFMVVLQDHTIEFIDVKGGGPVDAKSIVKVKVAAEKYWQFRFVVEQKLAKKMGGNWKRQDY